MSPRAAPLLAAAVLGAVALVRADQTIPAPVKNSDLIVRIEPVGQMPSPDNPTSPAIVGGHLFLIEQTGIIYDWDGATATEVLGPSNYPAGLNPVGREAILNAAADASGSKFYVVFIASDPPDGIPTWTTPRADPDAWEVVYQYDLSGTAIANPTPILALQIRSAGHTGGGLVCLADGSILLAVGDNGDAFQDGLVYPDDPTNHLGKILRIDPTGGSWQVVARGVRNIQRLVVDGTGDAARLNFVDIGGYIAEELDTIAVPDLIANGPANHFGWGEHAGDGHAREGTFFIDPGGMSL